MNKLNNLYKLLIALSVFLVLFASCLKKELSSASGTPNTYISILDARKVYKGSDVTLSTANLQGAMYLTGTIISDGSGGNMPAGTFAMQQTRRGLKRGIEIVVQGGSANNYKFGDSVTINVIGTVMSRNKGALQISVPADKITTNASNVPASVTIVDLKTFNDQFQDNESTLMKVANVGSTANGNTLSGDLPITDSKGTGIIHTESTATFSGKLAAINASYTGVARFSAPAPGSADPVKGLWPLNAGSITDESGAIYNKFPEDFETGDDVMFNGGSYSVTKTGNLKTGNYTLTNFALAKELYDKPVSGLYAARANQNSASSSWITMNYDLPNGASKVTVYAGAYAAPGDLGSTWRLEYSQNQGATWSQTGKDILTVSQDRQLFTFLLDLHGPVRFRIGKLGIGTSTTNNQNGRFDFDDLAVYQNPGGSGPITDPVPVYNDLLTWQFGNPQSTGGEATYNSTTSVSGLTTAVLSRGNGSAVSALARAFGSNSAGPIIPATKDIAVSQNVYFQVKFTVKPGSTLSLSAIDVKLRRSGAGAKYHKWYYSLDDKNLQQTQGTGDINWEGSDAEGADMPTYYLYQTPQLQNIQGGTTVTLRMYNWGFTNNGSGSFAIGRTPVNTITPVLRIGGKITP
ncbi:DUF5689 domain-containing protein [Mucilaginibacter boryungensis]|uniref:DUF5689 domain-containing protein n=1 Tax=Mucilaginibacter boryungensis TaxID=768480 RepID=A0ABR9XHS8_9SPHI|nr:DUF5689 domain-containing protein [Mucilaginibacter boryungensis]MBE9666770.1 hypothetical protein [Mucilaginibacter boryungensis]